MPLYEYLCGKCGRTIEVIQSYADPLLKICDRCGGELKKLMSAPAVQFKGSGWYVSDYGRGSGKKEGGEGTSETKSESKSETKSEKGETKSESKSESKSEGKSESKPESKSESKSETKSESKKPDAA
jgi:putative FmdB family regulatory protein